MEQTSCFLADNVIRLDVFSDQQGMRQQALTLWPCIILCVWKCCVDCQHNSSSPQLPFRLLKCILEHGLHQSMDTECFFRRVTSDERKGREDLYRLIQKQPIRAKRLQDSSKVACSLHENFFSNAIRSKECTHSQQFSCYLAPLLYLLKAKPECSRDRFRMVRGYSFSYPSFQKLLLICLKQSKIIGKTALCFENICASLIKC